MRQQVIYDMMDLVANFTTTSAQDDFHVFMFSIYSHNSKFRHVRLFDGIFDKDILRAYLQLNNLNMKNTEAVLQQLNWDFTLWLTAITVRRERANYYPRIAPAINLYLTDLVTASKEIYKATIRYIRSIDPDEFKISVKAETEDGEDDMADDDTVYSESVASTRSSRSSASSTSSRSRSMTLADIKRICKNHIPKAEERLAHIKERDEYITRKLVEQEAAQKTRIEKETARQEKLAKEAEAKAEREADRLDREARRKKRDEQDEIDRLDRESRRKKRDEQDEIDRLEREARRKLRAERDAAADVRRLEKEQKRIEKENAAALKLQLKQQTHILCACGEYYSKSNFVHHAKTNTTHLAYVCKL